MDVYIHRDTEFNKSLAALHRSGGQGSLAAQDVDRMIGMLMRGITEPKELGRLTKWGESRVDHCFKYDLPGFHRLICLRHEDVFWLLFVGKHDDCEKWLDRNRGLRVVTNKSNKRLSLMHDVPMALPLPAQLPRCVVDAETPLVDLLPEDAQDLLPPLKPKTYTMVRSLTRVSSDDDLMNAVELIGNNNTGKCYLNILIALRDHGVENAIAAINLYAGRADDWHQHTADALRNAASNDANADAVVNLRDLSDIEIKYFLSRSTFREWMLYLHPDQKRLANSSFDKPVVLRGVSGSGKTCVIVHRAKALADRYPNDRVGIFTLNRALANLISQLLDDICTPETRGRIDVQSVYDICRSIVLHFNPGEVLQVYDSRSDEHVEESWVDSFARKEQKKRLAPILQSLGDRGVDAERYLRDEFIWIRSAFSVKSAAASRVAARAQYEVPSEAPREGRSIAFSVDWRRRSLGALNFYEQWLRAGGFIEPAALSLEAHGYVTALRTGRYPANSHAFQYRCVLIDEDQDLGAVELEVLSSLAPDLPDGLLLSGDASQQVFPKYHDLKAAGLEGDSIIRRYLRKNYRNTKQILEAGLAMLERFGNLNAIEADVQILKPELSARESAKPTLFCFRDTDEEMRAVVQMVQQQRRVNESIPIGIVLCGLREDAEVLLNEFVEQFKERGLNTSPLRRDSKMEDGRVFVSAPETVKGFEFGSVILAQCSKSIIPDIGAPKEEAWRDARRLYVAMTRARDDVTIVCSGGVSPLVDGLDEYIIRAEFVFE